MRKYVLGALVALVAACSDDQMSTIDGAASGTSAHGDFVLAISWHAAFCETRPSKPECRSQTTGRFDADHFVLHGLWPQPRDNTYCRVDRPVAESDKKGRWRDLPRLALNTDTRAALDKRMPGTRSYLDRHEWIKHGTCYADDAQEYFAESIALLDQVNQSPLQTLFSKNIGKVLTLKQIERAADDAFGRGAGDRVEMVCVRDGPRTVITELRINLAGLVEPDTSIASLVRSAEPRATKCRSGVVDPVGLQ